MLILYLLKMQNAIEISDKFARYALGKYLNINGNELVISKNQYGKPYLVNYPNVYFSISHTKGAIACAVSDNPVGVDIERIRKMDLRVSRYFFSQHEKDYIFASSEKANQRFTEVWTKKEAYLKFLGCGIKIPAEKFNVFEKINNEHIRIHTEYNHDYIISICNISNETPDEIVMIDSNSIS